MNLPYVDCCVMSDLKEEPSSVDIIQTIGRGLRLYEGKKECQLYILLYSSRDENSELRVLFYRQLRVYFVTIYKYDKSLPGKMDFCYMKDNSCKKTKEWRDVFGRFERAVEFYVDWVKEKEKRLELGMELDKHQLLE